MNTIRTRIVRLTAASDSITFASEDDASTNVLILSDDEAPEVWWA